MWNISVYGQLDESDIQSRICIGQSDDAVEKK